MLKVLLLGAGKIGRMIAWFLSRSGDYETTIADSDEGALDRAARQSPVVPFQLDAFNPQELEAAISGHDAVLSALSYHHSAAVAAAARRMSASYFDLTEDISAAAAVRQIAEGAPAGQIFMPQCGLAPGFISIVAGAMSRRFDTLDTIRMRVGALPQFPTNVLKYNLTWSTDGLINEYCNPCQAIHDGVPISILPLEGLESFSLDGVDYEAFNTSGGLGTLCDSMAGKVRELDYKTIRYPGHRDLVRFLVEELRLGKRRELLKEILEGAIPVAYQDVVIVFCSATGRQGQNLVQVNDARKIYRQWIDGEPWSAIQVTTAAGICAALDLHATGRLPPSGFVRQEQIDLEEFLANRFGRYFAVPSSTRYSQPHGSE